MSRKPVVVVGLGDDGCRSLSSRAIAAIASAQVLVGGERQLAFFPEFHGERVPFKTDVAALVARVEALSAEHRVCVLASGDPLFYGLGGTLVEALGSAHVEVIPQPSSPQWAFAALGLRSDDIPVISLHGRPLRGVATRLRRLRSTALLTCRDNTPARIAAHLLDYGQRELTAHVCERLSGPGERVRSFPNLEVLAACTDIDPLNVLVLTRPAAWSAPPVIPYLPEEAFAKRMPKAGLITKREVRMVSLAALALRPDSVVWDVGTGSGAVAIEAGLIAYAGRVLAVEVDAECVGYARDNARALGADNVEVVAGLAPDALGELPDPDAVFVGGSKGKMQAILELAYARLKPGGSLVVNAITLENAHESYAWARAAGLVPEVLMLSTARAERLAHYMRYEAQNPIQVLRVTKPGAVRA